MTGPCSIIGLRHNRPEMGMVAAHCITKEGRASGMSQVSTTSDVRAYAECTAALPDSCVALSRPAFRQNERVAEQISLISSKNLE
jgi:hypothetical protein